MKKKLEKYQLDKDIILKENGSVLSTGEYREYKFENSQGPFNKEMVISIPYIDLNEDGIVDSANIDELTLDAYWYDDKSGEWKILADTLIFPKENIVTVKTNHFSIFGIAGIERPEENSPQPENPGQQDSGGSGSSSCFIATAAFGSPMAREVVALREFRDQYLLKSKAGKKFVNFYYHFSPPIAEFIENKPLIKTFLRYHIKLLVSLIQIVL